MELLPKNVIDKIGILLSTLCAIHCLLMPVVILLFPVVALTFFVSERMEIGILATSFFVAIVSLVLSYFRIHKHPMPMLFAAIGFSIFIVGKLLSYEMVEVLMSVIGGGFVVYAHYKNLLLNKALVNHERNKR